MKKEYYWFFILVLAAAIVAGSTLGMIMNFQYLSQQINKVRTQQQTEEVNGQAKTDSSSSPLEVKIPSTQTLPGVTQTSDTKSSVPATQLASNSSSQTSASGSRDKMMVVSQTEKRDMEMMLTTVGISSNKEFNERVREFQEKNTLPLTGIMDSQTLGALIKQATIHQANRHLERLN